MEAYLYDHGSIHALYLVASWNLFAGQSNVTHRSPPGTWLCQGKLLRAMVCSDREICFPRVKKVLMKTKTAVVMADWLVLFVTWSWNNEFNCRRFSKMTHYNRVRKDICRTCMFSAVRHSQLIRLMGTCKQNVQKVDRETLLRLLQTAAILNRLEVPAQPWGRLGTNT